MSTRTVTGVISSIYNVTTYLTLSQWPWNSYGHPNIIVVLNWEWSVCRNFAWGLQNATGQENKKKSSDKNSFGAGQRSTERQAVVVVSLFLLLMNAEAICLSEEESRWEVWFPLHFICAPQPLSVSPLCFHMLGSLRKQHSMKGKGQGRREGHSSFRSPPH